MSCKQEDHTFLRLKSKNTYLYFIIVGKFKVGKNFQFICIADGKYNVLIGHKCRI